MDGRGNGKADGEGDLFGVRSDGGAKKMYKNWAIL